MTTPIGQFVDSTSGRTSTNPFITIIMNRAPTGTDGINNALMVGQRWIDSATNNTEYFLLNFIASNGVVHANWVVISEGTNGIETLDGNTGSATGNVVTITTGAHNAQGTPLFTGSGSTLTLTFTDGANNTAIGTGSLPNSYTFGASENTFYGYDTGRLVTTSGGCTFLGYAAGAQQVSGNQNCYVGLGTGANVLTGEANTAIGAANSGGSDAAGGAWSSSESSNIAIGNGGVTGESNTIRIGSPGSLTSQQNRCFIAGINNVNSSGFTTPKAVYVDSSTGQLGYGTASGGDVTTLTGNSGGAVGPSTGNINLVGDGVTVEVVGNPGTNTLTISAISTAGLGVNIQTFTSSGTYTPTAGMTQCIIEVVGGGGGGGGTNTANTGQTLFAGGGGGGGYSRGIFVAASIGASQTVTIGAAGTAGASSGTAGGTGGTTSVGSLISATGGTGGGFATRASAVNQGIGGAGGTGSSGNLNTTGNPGTTGDVASDLSGYGGSSFFGGAAAGVFQSTNGSTAGNNATSYGGGGSGSSTLQTATSAAGGAGFAGYVIITEYVG